ncbi:MAG: hypothetical protein ACXV8X_14350, partial [Candidatus Angelobacter sp.]
MVLRRPPMGARQNMLENLLLDYSFAPPHPPLFGTFVANKGTTAIRQGSHKAVTERLKLLFRFLLAPNTSFFPACEIAEFTLWLLV